MPLRACQTLDPRPAQLAGGDPRAGTVNIPAGEIAGRTCELPAAGAPLCVLNFPPYADTALRALAQLGRSAQLVARESRAPASERGVWRLWSPAALLESVAGTLAPGDALDLACGTGRDAVYLAACGWRVTAVDWLPEALDRAARLERACAACIAAPIDWRCADLEAADLRLEPAGLVTMFRFLDRTLLARARDFVRPGGTLLVETFTALHRARHGKPRRAQFVLAPGELAGLLADWNIVHCDEAWRSDGAHTAQIRAT